MSWIPFDEGVRWIGHSGDDFAYDNETPAHRVFLEAFELADRLVTNAEYLTFVEAGGYASPDCWLDEGWAVARAHAWQCPLYWRREGGTWLEFTLAGEVELDPHTPVSHISFYEADAYARWRGARLATEHEWEVACGQSQAGGYFLGDDLLHPCGAVQSTADTRGDLTHAIRQAFGDAWEWTRSDYAPYPGYTPPSGALGEYNGKFMCGQYVLRGGSCATPDGHVRRTYRNFFYPHQRWQFTGLRLAEDGQ
jgi:ergothioneine biosynthesis protein EgtB